MGRGDCIISGWAALLVASFLTPAVAAAPAPPPPAGVAVRPALIEIGQARDGAVTYVARGSAAANVGMSALGGEATGNFTFRVGGHCLEGAAVSVIPTGVAADTTAWSFHLESAMIALVEDAPAGSCRYTARVTYTFSVTGAITVSQVDYTVLLRGRAGEGSAAARLGVIQ
jgi:hypothetical protein